MTDVQITNHGPKYIQGICDYGKVYIDLKFTKYVPMVGEKVTCVVGLNGKGVIHGRYTVSLISYTEKRKTKNIQKRERQKNRKKKKKKIFFYLHKNRSKTKI